MKKIIVLLLAAVWSFLAQAQTASTATAPGGATQMSSEAERARIGTERTRLEAGFTAEDTACYKKFMVNNCLDEVKVRRREAMADLRRQENSLNEQERKARGADQIQKTEDKASPEKQQEAADRRAAALKDFDDRMEREKQKNAGRVTTQSNEKANSDATAGRIKGSQDKASGRVSKQAATAEEVKKFNERQEKAKERQARHDRDQLNQTKPPAKSLPQPE